MYYWFDNEQLNEFLHKRKIASWPVRLVPLSFSYMGQLKLLNFSSKNLNNNEGLRLVNENLENCLTNVLTEKNCLNFAVIESSRDKLLGIVRLTKLDDLSKRANLEYWLTPIANDNFFLSAMLREVSAVAFHFLKLYQLNISGHYSDDYIQKLTALGFRCKNEYIKVSFEPETSSSTPTCFYFNRSAYIKTFGRRLRMVS